MFMRFSLLSVCCIRRRIDYEGISLVLFVSAGIIIVMSFRGSIGYAGICMRVLVYDLIVIACIVF